MIFHINGEPNGLIRISGDEQQKCMKQVKNLSPTTELS